jgi:hypothetical protein
MGAEFKVNAALNQYKLSRTQRSEPAVAVPADREAVKYYLRVIGCSMPFYSAAVRLGREGVPPALGVQE